MTFYIKVDDGIITDCVQYQCYDYIAVDLALPVPEGFIGGWYRWDGTNYHFDQQLYDYWMAVIESENHA